MRKFINDNFKYVLVVVAAIVIYFLILDLTKPSNGMTEEDLKKIEQIDKDINLLIENQKKLDESINEYKNEIKKIDSTISNLRIKKEVINNYYEQKGTEIKDANVKQVDSLLRSRYKF